jgi:hypothetical protein
MYYYYYYYYYYHHHHHHRLLSRAFSSWYLSWTNTDLHRSGFEFHTAVLSVVRGVVDNSLVRPTSRRRRTESIVSLEKEVCSCAELQVISCYRGWNVAC